MQEKGKMNSMDIKAYINSLRKNPKFTEEIVRLIEADLQYGLSVAEIEEYSSRRFDYVQMSVYSRCLRNGYTKETRDFIARDGLTGEQMAVALEFYEKGVPVETIEKVTKDSGQSAFAMKKLFQQIMTSIQEAEKAPGAQEAYARELLEQMKAVVEKIEFQEKRYDALNEKLKELKTAGQDAEVQNNLKAQLSEKDALLEKQQNELNDARVALARVRNDVDVLKKERDGLIKQREETKRQMTAVKKENQEVQPEKEMPYTQENIKSGTRSPAVAINGLDYHAVLTDGNGTVLSLVPIEYGKRKKGSGALTALFSRFTFKKKIDVMRLVAEKDLEPKQLMQVRNAIERGLSDSQLLVLMNKQIAAEQMEQLIDIAIYENQQEGRANGFD